MLHQARAVKKDGSGFECELSVSRLATSAGAPSRFTVVIRDTTERRRAEQAEAEAQAQLVRAEQLERELRSLDVLTASPRVSIAAGFYGKAPLRESVAAAHEDMVRRYGDLLDLALEQRTFRVEHRVSLKLRAMAEELAFLNAGPRDVVEIHSGALKFKVSGQSSKKVQALLEEGRLAALELMGYMVSFYRDRCVGTGRAASPRVVAGQTGERQGERT